MKIMIYHFLTHVQAAQQNCSYNFNCTPKMDKEVIKRHQNLNKFRKSVRIQIKSGQKKAYQM